MRTETAILLIRHGETDFNRSYRLQGSIDVPLNAEGKYQAKETAKRLKAFAPDLICTSALKRAVQTGEIISRELNVPVIENSPMINEASFGKLEGMTYSEIAKIKGISLEFLLENGLDSLGEAEPIGSVAERSIAYIRSIAEKQQGKKILLVSHGGVVRAVASKLLNQDFNHLYFGNGEGILILGRNGGWDLEMFRR